MPKQTRTKKRLLVLTVTLVAVVLVNVAVAFLPFRAAYPDVSGNGVYTLSEESRRLLNALDTQVELVYRANEPDPDIRSFLLQYQSRFVTVRVEAAPDAASDQTILLTSGTRASVLSLSKLFYYYSTVTGEMLSIAEYAQISGYLSAAETDDELYQSLIYYYGPNAMCSYFAGDSVISAALRNLTAEDLQMLYVFTGEQGAALDWYVTMRLEQYGFTLSTVTALSDLPSHAMLWLAPSGDLTETDAQALENHLENGGRMFLATSYQATNFPRLSAILSAYGLSTAAVPNLVLDLGSSSSGSQSMTQTFTAVKASHAINEAATGAVTVSHAHAIRIAEVEGAKPAELLRTSLSGGYVEQTGEETKNETGCFTLAASSVKGESRVVWLAMTPTAALEGYSSGKNGAWVASALAWLCEGEVATPIGQDCMIPSTLLNVKVSTFAVWIVVFAVLIPLGLLAAAIISRQVRNKRQS